MKILIITYLLALAVFNIVKQFVDPVPFSVILTTLVTINSKNVPTPVFNFMIVQIHYIIIKYSDNYTSINNIIIEI